MSEVLLTPKDQLYLQIMEDLNRPLGDGLLVGLEHRLHPDQIEQLKPLYIEGKKDLFLSCGRKWGKTELICYVLWRHALLNPGSVCYYVAPEAAHAKKILWDGMRIQKFLGKETAKYIKGKPNNVEMKIRLTNDSLIQIIGSDNYQVANGLTPHFAVYDEFKAFNPRWHVEFAPNRAAKAAPLIIIGTKPRIGNKNMEQYNDILEYMRTDKDSYVADRTTFDNPINHMKERKAVIDREIAQLRARGEDDVVQLEYYSKVVPGGKRAIFPMLAPERHMWEHSAILREIEKDKSKLEYYLIADPGSTTCFGTLFVALNPYTRKVYVLDEIYEKDQKYTTTGEIVPVMIKKCNMIMPNHDVKEDWVKGYDEAAAWFAGEALERFDLYFIPTTKAHNKKEEGLSLIKDQLIHNLLVISDKCPSLWKEMENYSKNDKGLIPKINDHLIDCLRYFNGLAHYTMTEVIEALKIKQDRDGIRQGRLRHPSDSNDLAKDDWTDSLFINFD